MELVPIVITSLEIVTVLAVIVLLSSYIAFKVRSKSEPEKARYEDVAPKIVSRSIKRLTMLTKEIVNIPKRPDSPKHSQPVPPQSMRKKENANPKQPIKHVEQKPKRLEIIKQLPVIHETEQEKNRKNNKKQKEQINSLGDEILNKYVDDDDHPLFSLNTDKDVPKE